MENFENFYNLGEEKTEDGFILLEEDDEGEEEDGSEDEGGDADVFFGEIGPRTKHKDEDEDADADGIIIGSYDDTYEV